MITQRLDLFILMMLLALLSVNYFLKILTFSWFFLPFSWPSSSFSRLPNPRQIRTLFSQTLTIISVFLLAKFSVPRFASSRKPWFLISSFRHDAYAFKRTLRRYLQEPEAVKRQRRNLLRQLVEVHRSFLQNRAFCHLWWFLCCSFWPCRSSSDKQN